MLRTAILISVSAALAGCGDCALTDDEVIRKAVEYYLTERQPGIEGYFENDGVRYQRYETFEEFVSVNPDCCRLDPLLPEFSRVPLLHRFWYSFRGVVYVASLRQRIENGTIVLEDAYSKSLFKYDVAVPVNRCGKPLMFLIED